MSSDDKLCPEYRSVLRELNTERLCGLDKKGRQSPLLSNAKPRTLMYTDVNLRKTSLYASISALLLILATFQVAYRAGRRSLLSTLIYEVKSKFVYSK